MTEAIFGLVGVLLGGLIAGGASYLLARRNEKLEARASARLLERELELVTHQLDEWRGWHDMGATAGTQRPRMQWLRQFSVARWEEHQSRLARVLEVDDWYAVSGAYAAIEFGQDVARRVVEERELRRLTGEELSWDSDPWTVYFNLPILEQLRSSIEAGVTALAGLAGGYGADREHRLALVDYVWRLSRDGG